MSHEGHLTAELEQLASDLKNSQPPPEGQFSNLFGKPGPNEVYGGGVRDTGQIHETLSALDELSKLVSANAGSTNATQTLHDNPTIHAGYTYFGQLVAHDMTFNQTPFRRQMLSTSELESLRSQPLILQTIYGDGPETMPWLYKLNSKSELPRAELRLSEVQTPKNDTSRLDPSEDRFQDLPRLKMASLEGENHSFAHYELLIADSRNSDNLILAQMVVLFHKYHNSIIKALRRIEPQTEGNSSFESWAQEKIHFEKARVLTCQSYRSVVRNDFLARLLDPSVYEIYNTKNTLDEFLTPPFEKGEFKMPVEFAMAAYRVGHAMVRASYRFNRFHPSPQQGDTARTSLQELLRQSLFDGLANTPLKEDWIIDWARFFKLDDTPVNASHMLKPGMVPTLRTHFPEPTGERRGGLIFRDFARSYVHRLRTVSSLINRYSISNLFPDYPFRRQSQIESVIESWFREQIPVTDEPSINSLIDAIKRDPPLLFFILLEAEKMHDGKRLGVLGSIIMAEVIFGSLLGTENLLPKVPDDTLFKLFPKGLPKSMPEFIITPQRMNKIG